ncbi:MAG: class III poly(R)-hydroxyalkanoic acid synthase subunit PhaC [Gammaproteobacteria bacterium]
MFANLDTHALLSEALEFNRKVAGGIDILRDLGEIDTGTTEREVVMRRDKLVLYRYTPQVKRPSAVPLLIVYALVNRPYMVDLQPDRSMVRALLDAGLDVYLIDWGYPDAADRYLDLDDYINGYIHDCVTELCRRHDTEAVNMLGICQGGALSTCYAALHPERVRNLVTMVTPIDFQTPDNLLSRWARSLDVDLLVDTLGNVPGALLNYTFLSMKPFRLTGQKYLDMVNLLDKPKALKNFMRMEKWIFDSPDQAGEAFRQFVKHFFQENRLLKGGLEIGGQPVDPARISMPVLNVYATQDHLVPPAASQALKTLVSSDDYSELAFKGGHIGIYVSGRAQREVPPAIAAWLKQR